MFPNPRGVCANWDDFIDENARVNLEFSAEIFVAHEEIVVNRASLDSQPVQEGYNRLCETAE